MFKLNNLVPIPLSDQLSNSDVWGTDFTFESEIRYFVEAPSGKGKTTLQHILYGLRKDFTGSVEVLSKSGTLDLKSMTLDQWADIRQNELTVIFQDLRLFPELTAKENILLKNNLTNHKSEEEIEAMAASLDVKDLLDKKCGEMSYGQRQRIAIIRALCQPFRFLIMDEPFAHLDSANVQKCCSLISEECQKQNAGFAVASLEEKYFFEYDKEVKI